MPTKEYLREYRKKRKEDAISQLGGQCVICGSKENLEFDHINPETKRDTISNMWTSNKEKLQEELNKCQLLCRSCHLKKSQDEGDYVRNRKSWGHGLSGYINYKCKCDICNESYKLYRKKRWKIERR
jgi:5-methylcytosine-specific restriction endonuclease McrA